MPAGLSALYQGDFGETWLEVVAAGCGLLHNRPSTLDLQKADIQLTLIGEVGGVADPTVQVQVRSTIDLRIRDDGTASFEVDVDTYEALRNANRTVRRVLMVLALEREGDRVRLAEDGTLLVGRAAWVSLEGLPARDNLSSITVTVPLGNTVDEPGLMLLMSTYGVPRSTPVPDLEVWGD